MNRKVNYDQKIHLADGDEVAAKKIIHEIRRDPVQNSLHQENPMKLPLGYIVGAASAILIIVLIAVLTT